jgi:hypothetical protein
MNHFETFERSLAVCIQTTFMRDDAAPAIGRPVPPPQPTDEEVVIASIGFAAHGARGGLVLFATRASAVAARPSGIEGADEVVDCDVIGELANMLLGSLKNQLLHRGVVLMLGTPMTTIARMARVIASNEPTSSTWFGVDFTGGRILVRLDACFEPGFEVVVGPDSVRSAGVEGDMLFF